MLVMISRTKFVQIAAWAASSVVVVIAVVAWGSSLRWQFSHLSTYRIFPIFGLLAFSLMWSHYFAATLRLYNKLPKATLARYFEITSWLVLFLIVMHPGLLVWQLWRDGLGLPPGSYLQNYVAPTMRWAALLGTVSLFLFLSYEFRRWFKDRTWWHWIEHITDLAMIFVFIHALRLGTNLMSGWFRVVWMFYGLSLLGFLAYIYYLGFAKSVDHD